MVVVAMRQNLHEFPDLVRLAHRLAIDAVFVQHLCHDFGESSLPAQYRPMRDFVEDADAAGRGPGAGRALLRRGARGGRRSWASTCACRARARACTRPAPPGRERCDWPWRGAYVSYQGLAMPCCMVATPDRINFGNMAETGAEAVWNGEEYQAFRRQLSSDRAARGLPLLLDLLGNLLTRGGP